MSHDSNSQAPTNRLTFAELASFIGRGQSPCYSEDETGYFAVSQKCVRNGKVGTLECRPHDSRVRVKDDAVLTPGDLCLNSTGTGTIGRAGLWESTRGGVFFADTHVTVIRPRREVVEPRVLLEIVQSPEIQAALETYCFTGSTNQIELNRSALLKLAILLPRDLEVQRFIASVVLEIDRLIGNTESLISKYQSIKQGMMHDLFTRGVDENGELRPPYEEAPELYKKTELGWVPKEWTMAKLSNLCDLIIDGTHFTPNYQDIGIPFLRVTDVQTDEIDFSRLRFISRMEHDILVKRAKPVRGDILYSKNGTVGIPKIVTWDWEFSIFVSLALIKPKHHKILVDFLCEYLRSETLAIQMKRRSKQGTVTNLHLEEIREFDVLLPPKNEQLLIVERTRVIDDVIRTEEAKLQKIRKIKQGLMHDLLSGKVRVPLTQQNQKAA
jgi:type I restriction enzyme S subunit